MAHKIALELQLGDVVFPPYEIKTDRVTSVTPCPTRERVSGGFACSRRTVSTTSAVTTDGVFRSSTTAPDRQSGECESAAGHAVLNCVRHAC